MVLFIQINAIIIIVHWLFLFFRVLGFCTEFNVAGGVIQSHVSAPCNKSTELRCEDVYYSTHAYKCKIIWINALISTDRIFGRIRLNKCTQKSFI